MDVEGKTFSEERANSGTPGHEPIKKKSAESARGAAIGRVRYRS